jgi:N-glycosylase/DNA lyase
MPTPKKETPKPEVIREEAKTFVAPKKAKVPVHGDVKVKKVSVNDQLVDAVESSRYPRNEQSANYRVQVIAPLTGIPMVHVAPVGWVGPAPFQFPEQRIDEVIQLLTKMR